VHAARVAIVLSVCAPAVYVTFNLGGQDAAVLGGAAATLHDGRALLVFGPALALALVPLAHAARRRLADLRGPVATDQSL
jgi:hypothetical protein